MQKPNPLTGFFLSYCCLILICFVGCFLFYPSAFNSIENESVFSYAVSITSLTHTNISLVTNSNIGLTLFSLFITQAGGILILSYLLFYYWQLFGSEAEKENVLSKAFTVTIVVSLIAEVGLFLFFMYGIPMEITNDNLNNKVLAALSLSINSFNNAGFSWRSLVIEDGFMSQNFILQIGVIGGSVLGSLGIYVIYDLLSPEKLRERLNDPSMDWSFMTKVSLFGATFILISGTISYYLIESNQLLKEANIVESVFASIYEMCSSRGFGFSLFQNQYYGSTNYLRNAVSIFGGGPFSTAGGITVLIFTGFILIFYKKGQRSGNLKTAISLAKNLLYYHLIGFSILYISMLLTGSEFPWNIIFTNQIAAFTNTSIHIISSNNMENLIQTITVIIGRVGFIIPCFLTLRSLKS